MHAAGRTQKQANKQQVTKRDFIALSIKKTEPNSGIETKSPER